MLVVEQWAELRRLHFVQGVSIKELARRFGVDRNTVRSAVRSSEPPRYARRPGSSKLDPFKDEIHRLLGEDSRLPNTRIGELIAEQGYAGHQTILDAYLREVRPIFRPAVRTYQRTSYRPGELAQFDLWQPKRELPVGFGQTRRGYVMVGALGQGLGRAHRADDRDAGGRVMHGEPFSARHVLGVAVCMAPPRGSRQPPMRPSCRSAARRTRRDPERELERAPGRRRHAPSLRRALPDPVRQRAAAVG